MLSRRSRNKTEIHLQNILSRDPFIANGSFANVAGEKSEGSTRNYYIRIKMAESSVVIVGGGLAGLAAAAALGARGLSVTLLESRPRLGGRAGSFDDQATGAKIDNCQHVTMGCCTNFDHFCRTVGIRKFLQEQQELCFVGPDGTFNRFAARSLPAPLHLFSSLLRLSYLSLRDKWKLARGLSALVSRRKASDEEQTMADWLKSQGQSPELIARFWYVVLVSALSESLDRINIAAARKVFTDGFLANKAGWQVQIPSVPLDTLYGTELGNWFVQHGVTIRLQSGVSAVEIENCSATGVTLRDGTTIRADYVILAVPHDRVLPLLPDDLQQHAEMAKISQLETAPISSVHLWFDSPVIDQPHAVLIDRLGQWMFNRGRVQLPDDTRDWHYYQVVISASGELSGRPRAEIISEVVEELAGIWPEVARAELKHARLVTEHKAVLSVLPGVDRFRPQQQSPIGNLQLAGDWTDTGWPSTMEGAVRSGYLAAENILLDCGRPERLIQDDLPVSYLSKVLFKL